jgi:hypothetical protein
VEVKQMILEGYCVEETTGYVWHWTGQSFSQKGTLAGHPGPWRDFGKDQRAAEEYSKQIKKK